jgi:integrase
MEWESFRMWGLVDGGLAVATVDETVRRLQRFERLGLEYAAIHAGQDQARAAIRPFLANMATSGKRHAYRNACKALNLYCASLGYSLRFDLPPAPKSQHKRLTDEEVAALLAYRKGSRTRVARRRRALIWLCWATGLRRGEIADLRASDFDASRGVLMVSSPRKEGKKREIPLPSIAWSPKGPLQAWLSKVGDGGLWEGMTSQNVSNELHKISREVGFRVSFTRFRHYRGKTLGKALVPIQVIQEAMGHSTPNTTRIYVQELTAGEMAAAFRKAGVPGFKS